MEKKSYKQYVEHLKYDDDEPLTDQQYAKLNKPSDANSLTDIENAIKLTMNLKKKIIQSSSFNTQTFPMLVSLAVDNLKSSTKAPLDLVCVLDHSGSMTGEKIQLVKNTFASLMKYLGDFDRLSIVIFDDQASRLVPLVRTTELNKKKIMSALKSVQGRGGTDINLGMLHAFHVLNQRRCMNPVTGIFLLSDGLDQGAAQRVKASLEEFHIPDDVTISTFGFGSDHDPQLMNDIADLRDGSFFFIEQLDTIDEAFVVCLGGLLSAIGQNVVIQIKPESSKQLQDVKITKAYGDQASWAKIDQAYITKMSNIMSGRQKDFVLEINIPSNKTELLDHEKNVRIASAEVEVTGLDNQKIVKKAELYVTILNETEELIEEEDDREVMKHFFRLKGAGVISEAKKMADQGKNNDAKKLLQSFKEELENSFLKNEDFIKNLIKDIEQSITSVNPVVYQALGRHQMVENARVQYHQKSNLKSANAYQNNVQSDMMFSVRAMKKK